MHRSGESKDFYVVKEITGKLKLINFYHLDIILKSHSDKNKKFRFLAKVIP